MVGLLLQALVEAGVLQRNRDVVSQGLQQLDVFAGQEAAFAGLPQGQEADGAVLDPAGDKVMQAQLVE